MVTKVIIFTILFLIAWIATINIFRVVCNKSIMDKRDLTLRVRIVDYIKYDDYNVIVTKLGDRSCEIRDLNKAFSKDIEERVDEYITISVCIMYSGFVILEPILVIKQIVSKY